MEAREGGQGETEARDWKIPPSGGISRVRRVGRRAEDHEGGEKSERRGGRASRTRRATMRGANLRANRLVGVRHVARRVVFVATASGRREKVAARLAHRARRRRSRVGAKIPSRRVAFERWRGRWRRVCRAAPSRAGSRVGTSGRDAVERCARRCARRWIGSKIAPRDARFDGGWTPWTNARRCAPRWRGSSGGSRTARRARRSRRGRTRRRRRRERDARFAVSRRVWRTERRRARSTRGFVTRRTRDASNI